MVVGWVGARAVDRGRGKSTDEEGVRRFSLYKARTAGREREREREVDCAKKQGLEREE